MSLLINVTLMQNTDDLSAFGRGVGVNAPFLAVCRTSEGSTIHVIVEQEPMCELLPSVAQ